MSDATRDSGGILRKATRLPRRGWGLPSHRARRRGDRLLRRRRPEPLRVDGLGKFIQDHGDHLRLGWGRLPDFEVLYLYDRRDSFGCAINVDDPELSEWGYAPFASDQGVD